jgi:hypothetical protein
VKLDFEITVEAAGSGELGGGGAVVSFRLGTPNKALEIKR